MDPSARRVLLLTVSLVSEPQRIRGQVAALLAERFDVTYVTLPIGRRQPPRDHVYRAAKMRVCELAGTALPLRLVWSRERAWGWYQDRVARRLQALLRREEVRPDVIVCFTPNYPRVLVGLDAGRRIYFANDDFVMLTHDPDQRRNVDRRERDTLALCSSAITVSETIATRLRSAIAEVEVFYPGHDSELPARVAAGPRSDRLHLAFFGYVDWRVDLALVEHLLASGCSVALYGPVVGVAPAVEALVTRFPDAFSVHPAIDPRTAPAVLARYDVLMMPYAFRNRAQAAAMEVPNKTFVYMAAGRPTVVTDMPNMKYVEPGLLYRARDHADFLHQARRAVQEDSDEHVAARLRIAAENTWARKGARLVELIGGGAGA